MKELLRQAALLALSAFLSWWLFLRVPPSPASPRMLPARSTVLELTPLVVDRTTPPAGKLVARSPEQGPGTAGVPPVPATEKGDQPELGLETRDEEAQLPAVQQPEATEPPKEYEPPPVTAKEEATPPEPEKPMKAAPPPASGEVKEAAPGPAPALPPATASAAPKEEQASEEESGETAAAESGSPEPSTGAPLTESAEPSAPAEVAPSELGTPEGTRTAGPALGAPPQPQSAAAGDGDARKAETSSRSLDGSLPTGRDDSSASGREDSSASGRDAARSVAAAMNDQGLVAEARDEFEHGQKKGFATVLLATPEDQIAIARFFGEELVLVPRHALDPGNTDPKYFHLSSGGDPQVEEVEGPAPLERHRQYRDLFDYDYARLPAPLRDLRRSVLQRGEVYLFAALLSPQEWALIIARRREALEHSGRELSEVRRFVLRYHRLPGSGFDLLVEEIVFADGTRFRPAARGGG